MGLRGPPPTPKKVLKARGSWRAKGRAEELEGDGSVPVAPPSLKGEGRAEWERIVGILGPKGVLGGDLDRSTLLLLCQNWGEVQELRAAAKRLLTGSNDWKTVRDDMRKSEARYSELTKRFGLTPADRPRVKASTPDKKAQDGKSRFFEPRLVG